MLLKIFKHGTGDPFKVDSYLLRDTDWTGEKRSKVEVLRGDPGMVSRIAADLSFVHKYTSGAFSFALEDNPSLEQIDEVLNLFEKTAWAGLDQERYTWTAVRHEKDGKVDVHVYAARIDLLTGKSMNIAPPGWPKTFNLLCEHFNYKYGWARPDDPARRRNLSPGKEIYLDRDKLKEGMAREDPREIIHRYVKHKIETGQVENRQQVVNELLNCGLEIPRQSEKYITVKDLETGKKYRMKGAFYEKEFTVSHYAKITAEAAAGDRTDNGIDLTKSKSVFKELKRKIDERAKYNRKTYPGPKPENFQTISGKAEKPAGSNRPVFQEYEQAVDEKSDHPGLALPVFLGRRLGSNSILPEKYSGADERTEELNPDYCKPGERNLGIDPVRKQERTIYNPAASIQERQDTHPRQPGSPGNSQEVNHDRDITKADHYIFKLSGNNKLLSERAESANSGLKQAIGQAKSADRRLAGAISKFKAGIVNGGRNMDRTAKAVNRQLQAFGCAEVDIGIQNAHTGKFMSRTWKVEDIDSKKLRWLKRMNCKHENIYVRPKAADMGRLVLIDDIGIEDIEQMKNDGLSPALVMETSEHNYQAWIKLDRDVDIPTRTEIARYLARKYDGDPGSADASHFGRLAGFTNRKHERFVEDKGFPFVLLHENKGRECGLSEDLISIARSRLKNARARQIDELSTNKHYQKMVSSLDASGLLNTYHVLEKEYLKRHESVDSNIIDFAFCRLVFKATKSTEETASILRQTRPDIEDKKKGHVDEYLERTAFKAGLMEAKYAGYSYGAVSRELSRECAEYMRLKKSEEYQGPAIEQEEAGMEI